MSVSLHHIHESELMLTVYNVYEYEYEYEYAFHTILFGVKHSS